MTQLRADTDHLHQVLLEAAQDRALRPDMVRHPTDNWPECQWAQYEREQMREAVNILRASRGLPAVHQDKIDLVERLAAGHSDYARKFAFYCAEIAQGDADG